MELARLVLPGWATLPHLHGHESHETALKQVLFSRGKEMAADKAAVRHALDASVDVVTRNAPPPLASAAVNCCHALAGLIVGFGGRLSLEALKEDSLTLAGRVRDCIATVRAANHAVSASDAQTGAGAAQVTLLLNLAAVGAAAGFIHAGLEGERLDIACAVALVGWIGPIIKHGFVPQYLATEAARASQVEPVSTLQHDLWSAAASFNGLHSGGSLGYCQLDSCFVAGPTQRQLTHAVAVLSDADRFSSAWLGPLRRAMLPISGDDVTRLYPTTIHLGRTTASTVDMHAPRAATGAEGVASSPFTLVAADDTTFVVANSDELRWGLQRVEHDVLDSDAILASQSLPWRDWRPTRITFSPALGRYVVASDSNGLYAMGADPAAWTEEEHPLVELLAPQKFRIQTITCELADGFLATGPVVHLVSTDVTGGRAAEAHPFGVGRPERLPLFSTTVAASEQTKLVTHSTFEVQVWDLTSDAAPLFTTKCHEETSDFVSHVDASPLHAIVGCGTDGGMVYVYDPRSNRSEPAIRFRVDRGGLRPESVKFVALHHGGTQMWVATRDDVASLYDLRRPMLLVAEPSYTPRGAPAIATVSGVQAVCRTRGTVVLAGGHNDEGEVRLVDW
jgi:hypothetical protein